MAQTTPGWPLAAAPRPLAAWALSPLAVGVILALWWVLLQASLRDKSATFDEPIHATGGYTYWMFNDYRINPENGNLPQRLAGLPLVLGDFRFPSRDSEVWQNATGWTLPDAWFHRSGNDFNTMLARGRAAAGLAAVALGALVWWWARRLFGPVGGMHSLLLYVLNPTILANGALITSDTCAAFFFLASTLAIWAVLERITFPRLVLCGLAVGGLFVSKMSAPLILPIAGVLAAIKLAASRPLEIGLGLNRQLASRGSRALAYAATGFVQIFLVAAVIWSFYGFRYSAFADDRGRFAVAWETVLGEPTGATPPSSVVGRSLASLRASRLLPEAYVYGQAFAWHSARGRFGFFNGEFTVGGSVGFFPYTFLVKTPLPLLAVLGFAVAAAIRLRREQPGETADRRSLAHACAPLLALFGVYWSALLLSDLNVGHRHMMATYPPLFILCGVAAYWWRSRIGLVLGLALAALAFDVGGRFPNYLAYFNGIVSPSQAYRHLVDSSLDWGGELPGVKRYIEQQLPPQPVYLSYFGTADPIAYGIRARYLHSTGVSTWNESRLLRQAIVPAPWRDDAVARLARDQPDYFLVGVADEGATASILLMKRPEAFRLTGGTYFISATLLQSWPWTTQNEASFRDLSLELSPFLAGNQPEIIVALGRREPTHWMERLNLYEQLRFARLAAFLRKREPDDTINYSILVYRLTDSDLKELGP